VETREGSTRRWSFGIFEVDTHSSDLRRSGTPVKLREQSFRILVLLLERAAISSPAKSCGRHCGLRTPTLISTTA
jgi:DNA-binding response OmpR family regulator